MTNCPNCGAPIEPYQCKCGYCGTWYFDFNAIDFEDGNPVYVKFKTSQGTITALTIPHLETVEMNAETTDVCDMRGNTVRSFVTSHTCDVNVNFRCIQRPQSKELFRIDISEV